MTYLVALQPGDILETQDIPPHHGVVRQTGDLAPEEIVSRVGQLSVLCAGARLSPKGLFVVPLVDGEVHERRRTQRPRRLAACAKRSGHVHLVDLVEVDGVATNHELSGSLQKADGGVLAPDDGGDVREPAEAVGLADLLERPGEGRVRADLDEAADVL